MISLIHPVLPTEGSFRNINWAMLPQYLKPFSDFLFHLGSALTTSFLLSPTFLMYPHYSSSNPFPLQGSCVLFPLSGCSLLTGCQVLAIRPPPFPVSVSSWHSVSSPYQSRLEDTASPPFTGYPSRRLKPVQFPTHLGEPITGICLGNSMTDMLGYPL